MATRAGITKQSFFEFRRFGEDTADDIRKVATAGAVLAAAVAVVFFAFQKLDGWDLYGRPARNWSLGLAVIALAMWVFERNFQTFGTEVVAELKRVTWPTWEEAKKNTMLVLGVMLLFSVTVFVYDQIFGFLFTRLLHLYQQ